MLASKREKISGQNENQSGELLFMHIWTLGWMEGRQIKAIVTVYLDMPDQSF